MNWQLSWRRGRLELRIGGERWQRDECLSDGEYERIKRAIATSGGPSAVLIGLGFKLVPRPQRRAA